MVLAWALRGNFMGRMTVLLDRHLRRYTPRLISSMRTRRETALCGRAKTSGAVWFLNQGWIASFRCYTAFLREHPEKRHYAVRLHPSVGCETASTTAHRRDATASSLRTAVCACCGHAVFQLAARPRRAPRRRDSGSCPDGRRKPVIDVDRFAASSLSAGAAADGSGCLGAGGGRQPHS